MNPRHFPSRHPHPHGWHQPPRGFITSDDLSRAQHVGGGDPFLMIAERIVYAGFVVAAMPVAFAKALIEHGIERSKMREMTEKMTSAGLPTPAQITSRFKTRRKKTLSQALELGAMLLAITPTLDARRVHAADGPLGGRSGGLKVWLAQYCPTVSYSSACRYRKLAERFLNYLDLDSANAHWTMSWIMPDKPLPETEEEETREAFTKTRAAVATLLRHYPSQRALHRLLATELPRVTQSS